MKRVSLVAVGDSISWAPGGWVYQLGCHIDADVVMLAVPGAEAHSGVPAQLVRLPTKFDLGTLYFGTNDTRRSWDVAGFEQALTVAARAMAKRAPLVMPTIPRSLRPWPPGTRGRVIRANEVIRAVAADVGAAVVPLDRVPLFRYWSPDLVHPRPGGQRLICQRAQAVVQFRTGTPPPAR